MIFFCCDERRRNALKNAAAGINGIDFLEVHDDPDDLPELRQRTLFIHFLKPLAPDALDENNVLIEGGERIRDIQVVHTSITTGSPSSSANNVLVVEVAAAGDFSTYTLRIVQDAARARAQGEEHEESEFKKPPSGFDPILSAVDFSFKILCSKDFDCRDERICPEEPKPQPEINYLAKDYGSFRQLMLDRMSAILPRWKERNPADVGIALVELLAYVGDYLSYQQDGVATEAYLGTARRRASVRRHARLVDYFMHDGSNARAWVQLRVRDGISNLLLQSFRETDKVEHPDGQQKIRTRFLTRVEEQSKVIPLSSAAYRKALEARPQVFEPLHDLPLYAEHNEMRFYTWGARECCLPEGATRATLRGAYPDLKPGYVLILAEVRGPLTGRAADADPARRHAVRLQKVTLAEDPIGGQFDSPASDAPLPVTEIQWHAADALPFPLCISSRRDTEYYEDVSVALGNIVLADHGLTVEDEPLPVVPDVNLALTKVSESVGDRCREHQPDLTPPRYRPRLARAPLTHAAPYNPLNTSEAASAAMNFQPERLLPVISLGEEGLKTRWFPKLDLLSSGSGKREFVVEIETDGVAHLRFGDDRFGSRPAAGAHLKATYRVGNGVGGNVGADSLVHIASNDPAIVTDLSNAPILSVRNPIAARGGVEPESIERVRHDAPSAFRTQERAVTMSDYAEMARSRSSLDIQHAAATLRWTGSWHTVFLSVDRFGGRPVDARFEKNLRRKLERYRMAGHDIEVDAPHDVSLEIEMVVCVKRGYLSGDVKQALLETFSNRVLPDGRRGVFHPDNFSFGQPVLLSRLYAAAQSTPGVDSVDITVFQRQGVASKESLESGRLELGQLEIARLDNNPDFPERGVFRLEMRGGR